MFGLVTELAETLAEGAESIAPGTTAEIAQAGERLLADALPSGLKQLAEETTRTPAVSRWLEHASKILHEPDIESDQLFIEPPNPFREKLERTMIEDVLPQNKLDVLEIGPSSSSTVPFGLADRLNSYTAVDMDKSALQSLRAATEQRGVDTSKNYFFIKANGVDLPVKSSSQDLIYMAGATDAHLPWTAGNKLIPDAAWTPEVAEHALKRAADALRPGGKLITRPWDGEQSSLIDFGVIKRYFTSAETRSLPSSSISELGPLSPYGRNLRPSDYQYLVLTK